MMKICFRCISPTLFLSLLCFPPSIVAQSTTILDAYTQTIDPYQILKHGISYEYSYPQVAGFQYLNDKNFDEGSIHFDGRRYDKVLINYDLYNELLILSTNIQSQQVYISLPNAKLSSFNLKGLYFEQIEADKINGLEKGIYHIPLYKNGIGLFINIHKEIIDNTGGLPGALPEKFVERKTYYILKEQQAYLIKNKKSLLALFPSMDLKPYIKLQKLKFKEEGFTQDIMMVLRHVLSKGKALSH